MTHTFCELLLCPERAAMRVGQTIDELAALRRRGAGPRFRRYGMGVLYATTDLDAWREMQVTPQWATQNV